MKERPEVQRESLGSRNALVIRGRGPVSVDIDPRVDVASHRRAQWEFVLRNYAVLPLSESCVADFAATEGH